LPAENGGYKEADQVVYVFDNDCHERRRYREGPVVCRESGDDWSGNGGDRHDTVSEILAGGNGYPAGFDSLSERSRPKRLFWRGAAELLGKRMVMVCGARDVSEEGSTLAYRCGRMLGDSGLVVASGYARGVDLAAHRGALDAGGDTLAFLPFGISRFRVRRELDGAFDPGHFLAVSELEPWQVFTPHAALRRNKLLVAVASAVIVVEPGESGGSWYSAKKARDLGKPLFFLEGARPEIVPAVKALGGVRLEVSGNTPDLRPVLGY
jgi:DNA processing protein